MLAAESNVTNCINVTMEISTPQKYLTRNRTCGFSVVVPVLCLYCLSHRSGLQVDSLGRAHHDKFGANLSTLTRLDLRSARTSKESRLQKNALWKTQAAEGILPQSVFSTIAAVDSSLVRASSCKQCIW